VLFAKNSKLEVRLGRPNNLSRISGIREITPRVTGLNYFMTMVILTGLGDDSSISRVKSCLISYFYESRKWRILVCHAHIRKHAELGTVRLVCSCIITKCLYNGQLQHLDHTPLSVSCLAESHGKIYVLEW